MSCVGRVWAQTPGACSSRATLQYFDEEALGFLTRTCRHFPACGASYLGAARTTCSSRLQSIYICVLRRFECCSPWTSSCSKRLVCCNECGVPIVVITRQNVCMQKLERLLHVIKAVAGDIAKPPRSVDWRILHTCRTSIVPYSTTVLSTYYSQNPAGEIPLLGWSVPASSYFVLGRSLRRLGSPPPQGCPSSFSGIAGPPTVAYSISLQTRRRTNYMRILNLSGTRGHVGGSWVSDTLSLSLPPQWCALWKLPNSLVPMR